VYSFEPTFYAFSKLQKNLELNPELAERIVVTQSFVSSSTSEKSDIEAYASWKVAGAAEDDKHQVHGGTIKSTEGIGEVCLDDFVEQNQIERLDFIKIDTDGQELEVLSGGSKVIDRFRPAVIFEIGIYVMAERGVTFLDYSAFFDSLDYSLCNSKNFERIDAANYDKQIPLKGTIDILAVSNSSQVANLING
jgi:FkbM family methyltransferase